MIGFVANFFLMDIDPFNVRQHERNYAYAYRTYFYGRERDTRQWNHNSGDYSNNARGFRGIS